MKVKPLGDRVLVRTKEPMDRTKGGIYVPDVAKKKEVTGEVLAIGHKVEEAVQIGQKVIFNEWSGNAVPGDPTLIIMREDDLLGIIES